MIVDDFIGKFSVRFEAYKIRFWLIFSLSLSFHLFIYRSLRHVSNISVLLIYVCSIVSDSIYSRFYSISIDMTTVSHEANPFVHSQSRMRRFTKKEYRKKKDCFRLSLVYILNVKAVQWILEDSWLSRFNIFVMGVECVENSSSRWNLF